MKWLKSWAFAAVPLIGIVELGAHIAQVRGVTPDSDWAAAKAAVESQAKADDLVAFAPRWVDPIGREHFGGDLATLEREAPGDVTRFPRAFEVSIRGGHEEDLSRWKKTNEQTFGAITVSTLENPGYHATLDDLVADLNPQQVSVSRADPNGETPCNWVVAGAQTGNLGFGPTIPAQRFDCAGSHVGVSVVADMDYYPHRCIYAPPPGGNAVLRIKFANVLFGDVLHGNHGLYVEAERSRTGAPVSITFSVGDKKIGKATHNDGDSWKGFEFSTGDIKGQRGDLVAEISSANGNRRMYCFEAITR
jgi:hypothetical protein